MSQYLLPQAAEVRKLALSNAVISGGLLLKNVPRVGNVIHAAMVDEGETSEEGLDKDKQDGVAIPINASLKFFFNERSKIEINIAVSASVNMQCQRCLDPVAVSLDLENRLVVVAHDDEARSLQKEIDPIIADDGMVDIHCLVEDEILLALPVVNYHAENDCNAEYIESLSRLKKDFSEDWQPEGLVDSDQKNLGEGSGKSLGGSLLMQEEQLKKNPFEILKTLKSKS